MHHQVNPEDFWGDFGIGHPGSKNKSDPRHHFGFGDPLSPTDFSICQLPITLLQNGLFGVRRTPGEAVKAALVSEFGIDSSRLQTAGKGSSEPVSTENTVTAKALNRRVTISKL